jgi:transcriptional regulator with XRE-family HTH domain
MADTIHTRIARLLHEAGKTQRQLATATGVTPQAVNQWLGRGKAKKKPGVPDPENLKAIAEFFGTTVDYLLKGTPGIQGHINSIISVDSPRVQDVPFLPLNELMVIRTGIQSVKSMARGSAVQPKHPVSDEAVAFSLQDSSMTPEFSEQDIIIIDPQLDFGPGDFVAAHIKSLGINVFRQFAFDGSDHRTLAALNPQHRTFRFTHEQWDEDVVILGTWAERTTINPKSLKRHTS